MAVQRRKKGDVQQQEPIEAGELDQGRSHVTRVENVRVPSQRCLPKVMPLDFDHPLVPSPTCAGPSPA